MKLLVILLLFLQLPLQAQKCNGVILHKKGYAVCYVDSLGHAEWVVWDLKLSDLGSIDRQNDFRPDYSLPLGYYVAKPTDYRNSGFDKGHLCNSADRTSSIELNEETFLLSNMIPQSPHNNEITWKSLEDYCRTLAKQGWVLHIIAGACGTGGEGKKGYSEKIANRINVPANTWKVVKYTKQGITNYIYVDMPNNQTLSKNWQSYQINKQDLEKLTGLSFDNF